MRVLAFFVVLFSLSAYANRLETVFARGNASAYCRGDGAFRLCLSRIEQQAQADAEWQADNQCRFRNGILLRYTASCSMFCSPPYASPDRDEFVRCDADCRYSCQVP
ncbi:MAG: hypothetical protein ACK5Y2_03820 [Bdellovibrionales bacterium]